MSDRATRLGFVSAASSAFFAQIREGTHTQQPILDRMGATQVSGPSTDARVENSGDCGENSPSGGDKLFVLGEFDAESPSRDTQLPQTLSKSVHNGMDTRIIVPPRSGVKSTVPVGSGQLAASSGDTGSLSVRLSLNKKRPLQVRSEEEDGHLTEQWDLDTFMKSSRSAIKQAEAEFKVQILRGEKFAAGQLHSMIKFDREIDDVEDSQDAPRLTEGGRPCCSHPGCTKQAQTKGKCISHGGVRECKVSGCTATAKWRSLCTEHGGRRTCSKADCEKLALSGGTCLQHGGGGGKTCSFPDCTTRPQRRGLCAAHGGYIVCKTEGCDRRAASKGLCSHHTIVDKCKTDGCEKAGSNRGYCYKHAVENGTIKVSRKPKCKEDGCVKIQLRQGYCSRHAQERGLSVGRTCKAEGCSKVAQAGGFCGTHGGGTRCKISGCNKSIVTKGLCSAHGGRKTCKVEGCEKWGLSSGSLKGYCVEHGGGYRCKHPGCTKSVQYNGLCCTHGGRLKCEAKGCNKTVRVKGFCATHQSE
ncbi:hypothetical protein PC129_g7933 [Phytophthora cactorum]|uniref:WRKY19-like zinc finger domain-containing protein n=1 Tax=Phytophthora cactorum TaxID=29920 RepID=A0A329S1Z9_9STRA|nr:hypothetical protein Pcac1_g22744 [Phytophthora cactorum]KAG2826234.1 hypothetical protein PC112_g9368 [Phytophthora cactorum]KAG2835033.1 hypothetical protein PC111_g5598 [Phytophthora cactorum]KAG2859530.1 hypothetical protein PC113_g8858 [Phytophthora cactorum]KAG2911396.1 hypothetical protein PC114_g9384 [Phytophthora cactorum]